jgi:hypothetical protein
MLGTVENLKFEDHDLSDEKKFLELAPKKYLKRVIFLETSFILVEPQTWATGLDKSRIMNLLEIPHFGRSVNINTCVNMLLSCVHGGYLWLEESCP